MSDVEVILGEEQLIGLASGTKVILGRLKARQFFKLLRIVTHGAAPILPNLQFNSSLDEFTQQLLTMVLFSIPDAEDEVIEFVASMVKPIGLREGRSLNKQDREFNNDLWSKLSEELYNPELEDLMTIVEAIVRNESEDLQALGKRLAGLFKMAQKMGQVPEELASKVENSSEDSPEQ